MSHHSQSTDFLIVLQKRLNFCLCEPHIGIGIAGETNQASHIVMGFTQADLASDIILPAIQADILMRLLSIPIDVDMYFSSKFDVRVREIADRAYLFIFWFFACWFLVAHFSICLVG